MYETPDSYKRMLIQEATKRPERATSAPMHVADYPTVRMPALPAGILRPTPEERVRVTDAIQELPAHPTPVTRPVLQLDQQGRPFYACMSPYEDTLLLIGLVVDRYREISGVSPAVVLVSAWRYLTFLAAGDAASIRVLQSDGTWCTLPLVYEPGTCFEVCARGEAV